MSDASPAPLPARRPFFRPVSLLAGLAAGMLGLAWVGRDAARRDWHPGFTRWHQMIAPESSYQPTVDEMVAIVRARCRPDQVLVLVGGNSIFYGVGQPADRVWTRELQDLLGPGYAVVNFAFRGGSVTDGGAVIAEVLRDEYPRLIYVANSPPLIAANPAGGDNYRFLLLDALYKGRLLPWAPRDRWLGVQGKITAESAIGGRLDAWLHYRTAWNWWSYRHFSPVPNPLVDSTRTALTARQDFKDAETDYDQVPFQQRFSPSVIEADLAIARGYSERFYVRDAGGAWRRRPQGEAEFNAFAEEGFPTSLRARTLIVISRNSPYYTARLEPEIRERDDLAVADSIAAWSAHGYQAMDSGTNFAPEDYGDRTHLTVSGGRKLAANLAPKVRELAARLGRFTP